MQTTRFAAVVALGLLFILNAGDLTNAAEIKLLSTPAVKAVVEELLPQYELTTGNKVAIQFNTAALLKRQIDAGETFDVAILTPALIDDLLKQSKIKSDTRVDIARSGMGLAIRAGAARPDISTVEAFKRTLLNAKSITYSREGASTAIFLRVLDRLGIADEMKSKTKIQDVTGRSVLSVAAGEAELAPTQISEILPVAGAELAGPFPPELQSFTVFTAGVSATTKEADAAMAVIRYLTTPAANARFKSKGLEPVTP